MYVKAISILLFFGKSTPAIRATFFPPKLDNCYIYIIYVWTSRHPA